MLLGQAGTDQEDEPEWVESARKVPGRQRMAGRVGARVLADAVGAISAPSTPQRRSQRELADGSAVKEAGMSRAVAGGD